MLILRIKQAEVSLANGRLDEAYKLVQADDLREHKRGQQLMSRLARALVERANNHLDNELLGDALADCNKAEKIAGNLSTIAQLRAAIYQAGNRKGQKQQQQTLKLTKAREHINNGWLSMGEQMLGNAVENDTKADMLLEYIGTKRIECDVAVRKAQEALKRGDLETALEVISLTGSARHQNKDLVNLSAEIKKTVMARLSDAINEGRIDRAQVMLQAMAPLVSETLELQEIVRAIEQLSQACQCITKGQPHSAIPLLQKLKSVLPGADWLDRTIDQVKQAAQGLDSLNSGPLGWLMSGPGKQDHQSKSAGNQPHVSSVQQEVGNVAQSGEIKSELPVERQLPARFVIQIDGIGSFMVLRKSTVTIGAISSSQRCDVGLVADPNLPMVKIEHIDEDYFIRADEPVHINDKSITDKLLASGDRINLSRRCGLKFHLPNPASATATLLLSGARHPRLDIRQIILLDRQIIIGPGSSAHIRVDRCSEDIILFVQNGQMLCRTKEPVKVNGRVQDRQVALAMEAPINIGDFSLVLTKI